MDVRACSTGLFAGLILGGWTVSSACSPSAARDERFSGSGGATGGSAGNFSVGGTGNGGGNFNLDSGSGGGSTGPCTDGTGWGCKNLPCDGQPKTSVRAKVYDPSGQLPLYNVVVYVPNKPVEPITDGPACETCATPVS